MPTFSGQDLSTESTNQKILTALAKHKSRTASYNRLPNQIRRLHPLLQQFINEHSFDTQTKKQLVTLLLNLQYKDALLFLNVLDDKQIAEINRRIGTFPCEFSPYGFYIFAQKLLSYNDIIENKKQSSEYPYEVNYIGSLLNDRGVYALKNHLVGFKDIQTNYGQVLLNDNVFEALDKKWITAGELTMTCSYPVSKLYQGTYHECNPPFYIPGTERVTGYLFRLINSDLGRYALAHHLITPKEASITGELDTLLTKNGIEALEQKLITPDQAAKFICGTGGLRLLFLIKVLIY